LREIQTNWTGPDQNLHKALIFNRRLWCIFFAEAESNESPNSLEVRQGIANIAIFVFARTFEMQTEPDPAKLTPLIDINCNIAAGLAGRPLRMPRTCDGRTALGLHSAGELPPTIS